MVQPATPTHQAPSLEEMTRLGISSTFEIACLHYLPYHHGKCARQHGHNYKITFRKFGMPKDLEKQGWVGSTPPGDLGMLMDFGDFDAAIKQVLNELDHWPLNDDLRISEAERLGLRVVQVLDLPNPTAEHLALWLLSRLPMVDEVEVWETGKHSATATRPQVILPPQMQQQLGELFTNMGRLLTTWLGSALLGDHANGN